MITTPANGMSVVQAASLLAAHLAEHALPQLASLTVTTGIERLEVTAQLQSHTGPSVASVLLAWADTLSAVTVQAWRPSHGERVHLCILSSLTSSMGALKLCVYGGVTYDPVQFPDLEPGEQRQVPLGQLRSWAANQGDR